MSQSFNFSETYDGLKDFQLRTVHYAFDRLYRDPDSTRRFLVADEVGLGKTLVAKGITAHATEHLAEEGVERIDVIYICSNADIARQNIRRLTLPGFENSAYTSRLTLLPLEMRNLTNSRLNFIAFTPGTAFTLHGGTGMWKERVVLYWLLKKKWPQLVGTKRGPLRVFQCGIKGLKRFEDRVKKMKPQLRRIDRELANAFWEAIDDHDEKAARKGEPGFRERFEELASEWAHKRAKRSWPERHARNVFIGDLRTLLARTCVEALEPDLVILDEFQRFRDVLDPETETGELARSLFEYSDDVTDTRVLLLSATPYKMYTLRKGAEEEDHYSDFLATTDFLMNGNSEGFAGALTDYGQRLRRLDPDDLTGLVAAKERVESLLRNVMCRTERLASNVDRNGMLEEVPMRRSRMKPEDYLSYVALDRAAAELNSHSQIEYWKSAPYFPNFWDSYKVGRDFEHARLEAKTTAESVRRVLSSSELTISWDDYVSYRKIDLGNDRLRYLHTDLIDSGVWKLLWMPASLPYYESAGVYKDTSEKNITKRLVFSSWNVVPRVVSTLTSYEASRHMMSTYRQGKLDNTPEGRERIPDPLRFPTSSTSGMSALAFVYPSVALAELADPLEIAAALKADRAKPNAASILRTAESRLGQRLRQLVQEYHLPTEGAPDERWYWAAPLILDSQYEGDNEWLDRHKPTDIWTGPDGRGGGSGFRRHVELALSLYADCRNGDLDMGRMPDDLARTLALLAVGGPATIAYRALKRTLDLEDSAGAENSLRDAAARIGWGFRSLFNLPEVSRLVRGSIKGGPYWRKALRYSVHGCLQAVMDEYVYVLREFEGMVGELTEEDVSSLAETIVDVVSLRSSDLSARDPLHPDNEVRRMRCHFALPFGNYRTEEESGARRSSSVRTAFNSPFWPFVLTTTSVGQEGLDFHLYCHAIIHWNLPANPVDLEQREGRIHRYMGHAVRKNLAAAHGNGQPLNESNPWSQLLDRGRETRDDAEDDLVPYWLYPGEAAIERHVPRLPLSRDDFRLADLRRSLALYRLAFGQSRQEELVDLIGERLGQETDIDEIVERLRINLVPRDPARSNR